MGNVRHSCASIWLKDWRRAGEAVPNLGVGGGTTVKDDSAGK
jgi:hypothetical protein